MGDDINACDKYYLVEKCVYVGTSTCSLAEEYKRLCEDKDRVNIVKGCSNFKKLKINTKVKERIYHLNDKDEMERI